MTKKLLTKALLAFFFVVTAGLTVSAQKLNLEKPIPIGPEVTKGHLENGLTYYIRSNDKPQNKVQLRLVLKAGSILENDNQQGLAHFMEHMNFNGLEHFPKHELIHFLESIGVKFGADLNANTGFDRTYYILPIPTDKKGNLKKGFQILADWADGALITSEQVNNERKIVYEELRLRGKNAGTRMMKQYIHPLLNNSRYADRLPIGKKEVIMNADPQLIRDFYHDWYRPNLMAVIVVGDVTTEKAESMIKKYFGDLENPKDQRERKIYEVEPYTEPSAMVVTDPEAMRYNLSIYFPAQQKEKIETLKDYRASLVRNIFRMALNQNLRKRAQTAKPPYAGAFASLSGSIGAYTLTQKGFMLGVTPIDDFKTAVDAAVAEVLQVRQYGFSKRAVENAKQKLMASYEKAYKERNKTRSKSLVNEYTRNFMQHEPIPGIANEYTYAKAMLPTITAKEVSELAQDILSHSKNFFALIKGPEDGDIDLPTDEELLTMVQEAFQQEVAAPQQEEVAKTLLTKIPVPGKIFSKTQDKDLGTTTYTLSNGVKVTVKNTDFKADEIIFKGVKYGGSGQYGAEDKANVALLTSVVGAMGYGQFTPTELDGFLSGKTVSLQTSFGGIANGVSGSSSVNDFETLLKLNYLKLTAPHLNKGLYKGFVTKMKTRFQFLKGNPRIAFLDSLFKVMYHNDPLTPIVIPSPETLDKVDVNRVLDIYNKEFGYADGFHFFIVGNLDSIAVKPLLKKYLASLPVKGEAPMYEDNGLRMVNGDKVFKFYKGHNDKSMIWMVIHGEDIDYSQKLGLKAELLSDMMTMQITDTIREKMQVIYGGGATANIIKRPYEHYKVSLRLPTGPKSVEAILEELNGEFKEYQTNGGPEGALDKAKKALLQDHQDDLNENDYWAAHLEDILFWGNSKDFFLNYPQKVKRVTLDDIIQTAQKLLSGDRFLGISYPEDYKPEKQ